jgi:nicotinamidase-related amidase
MESVLIGLADKVSLLHTAVLAIDMQNAFCAEGDTSTKGVDKSAILAMIPGLRNFLSRARERGVPILFVRSVMEEKDFSPRYQGIVPAQLREGSAVLSERSMGNGVYPGNPAGSR